MKKVIKKFNGGTFYVYPLKLLWITSIILVSTFVYDWTVIIPLVLVTFDIELRE